MESNLYDKKENGVCICRVCPRQCRILPSRKGWCRTRWNDHGMLKTLTYGLITSAALDPIEKKPLAWFHPGSRILSLGSWGCKYYVWPNPILWRETSGSPGRTMNLPFLLNSYGIQLLSSKRQGWLM